MCYWHLWTQTIDMHLLSGLNILQFVCQINFIPVHTCFETNAGEIVSRVYKIDRGVWGVDLHTKIQIWKTIIQKKYHRSGI